MSEPMSTKSKANPMESKRRPPPFEIPPLRSDDYPLCALGFEFEFEEVLRWADLHGVPAEPDEWSRWQHAFKEMERDIPAPWYSKGLVAYYKEGRTKKTNSYALILTYNDTLENLETAKDEDLIKRCSEYFGKKPEWFYVDD